MSTAQHMSIFRIRLGVFFFILWWIPIYLTLPTVTDALGISNNKKATTAIFVSIIVVQTILGIVGVLLAGKEMASTLKEVKFKKLPKVVWKILWSAKTDIDPADLKVHKAK